MERDAKQSKEIDAIHLVSVVIVSWNRMEDIRRCLESIQRSTYPSIEVIVVDNNSTDGTVEMLESDFPQVRVIANAENRGACAARNQGFAAAKGDYIVILDDDSEIGTDCLPQVVERFDQKKDIGVLTFKIVRTHDGGVSTQGMKGEVCAFWGCGAAFRRGVVQQAGGFREELFVFCEEYDLSVRLLNHGFKILYCPDIVSVQHVTTDSDRHTNRRAMLWTRNYLWVYSIYFPWVKSIVFCIRAMAAVLNASIKQRTLPGFIRGLWHGVWGLPRVLRNRQRIRRVTSDFLWNPDTLPDQYNKPLYRKLLRKLRSLW